MSDDINEEHQQKNHELFLRQKKLLDQFLASGAITREQYEKSLGVLEKTFESHDS